ncbi:glycosyltransferase family 2 protein [Mucilaginibacter sp.]|jgi:glycosyltransferase involved in cell wall biosynthesis|uniref:glycosyltransferase family 2 protein n=1 Tax=Mucilaginibacter sp. TaxID=1882438 RepID=UPI003567750F
MNTLALCIPAYNAEAFLPRLLQSAKDQIIPFDEILVYNDCSTDKTALVAAQYGVTLLNGNINKGCSYGKNQLAAHSTCKWLHFHDADDDLLPDFTEKVHKRLKANADKYDVLLLNFNYVDSETGNLLGTANHNITELHTDALKYAISNKIVNFGVYKRQAFLDARGFDLDPDVLYNEDNALHQRLAKYGLKFDYLPEITGINYRYNSSMSSSNRLKCIKAQYYVLKKTAATHGKIYPKELADQLYACTPLFAAESDWLYVKKALKLCAQLGNDYTVNGGRLFKFLTFLHPFAAVWLREQMIRLFKPHLRKHA